MGYSEENNQVVLRISKKDYESVLLGLGIATGALSRVGQPIGPWLQLINRLNEGNLGWKPYSVTNVG